MAAKKTTRKNYVIQGQTCKITAVSRCAVKMRDNYYTVEAMEERLLPSELAGQESYILNMQEEWKDLFDSVNSVVDGQIEDITMSFAKNKR